MHKLKRRAKVLRSRQPVASTSCPSNSSNYVRSEPLGLGTPMGSRKQLRETAAPHRHRRRLNRMQKTTKSLSATRCDQIRFSAALTHPSMNFILMRSMNFLLLGPARPLVPMSLGLESPHVFSHCVTLSAFTCWMYKIDVSKFTESVSSGKTQSCWMCRS